MSQIIVTGDAGFIGFHLSRALLAAGHNVLGIDGLTDYYSPQLKLDRLRQLEQHSNFRHFTVMLEDLKSVEPDLLAFAPQIIIHLAAQAGVRYSLENPDAYVSSNVEGTLRVLELARAAKPSHLLIASTSSVYGGNAKLPFSESDVTQTQVSLYAATKLASEALAHSFSHLWKIPTTCLRLFTVYGPWGRPDMALFKFVDAIKRNEPIDVYGHGAMARDFTYIDDLVASISALIPLAPSEGAPCGAHDTLSPVAPYRIVNLGAGSPTQLMEFVSAVETAVGTPAKTNMLPMQPGDVVSTCADPSLLHDLIGQLPATPLVNGVDEFVEWHRIYFVAR